MYTYFITHPFEPVKIKINLGPCMSNILLVPHYRITGIKSKNLTIIIIRYYYIINIYYILLQTKDYKSFNNFIN